ncbi:hypothetical protein NCCNTM_14430 [Mycolicibacterium sp. NCC-Tsukiji]|nr:hypothetical protein NCCNTM_14430 [Mycolicibacterium sp. NCC-Tsukiji]
MNTATWIVSGVLAATFLIVGLAKSTMSKAQMIASGQTGVTPWSLPVIRFVGLSEIAAAVGLIVPWLSGIAPLLTPLAALGLVVLMIGAAASHWSLGEYKQVFLVNLVILATATLVTVVRFQQWRGVDV